MTGMKAPALLAALILSLMSGATWAEERPNVIFILADDLGYRELGCYGQEKIKTPRIDALAAGGMRFTRAYSGNAVCAPSRCVLMTGKHPGHATVRDNRSVEPEGQHPLRLDEVLKAALATVQPQCADRAIDWSIGPMPGR